MKTVNAVPATPGTYTLWVNPENGMLQIDEPILAWVIESYHFNDETTYGACPVAVVSTNIEWVLYPDGRVYRLHNDEFSCLEVANMPDNCDYRKAHLKL